MHDEPEHSPDERALPLQRPLRPFLPPRNPAALTRRRFLRGSGVLVALPFLDSLPALAQANPAAPTAPPRRYPQRFAAIFQGNGINANHWWAKGTGTGMEIGRAHV